MYLLSNGLLTNNLTDYQIDVIQINNLMDVRDIAGTRRYGRDRSNYINSNEVDAFNFDINAMLSSVLPNSNIQVDSQNKKLILSDVEISL